MNQLDMNLTGSDLVGWTWAVRLDGIDVFRTAPMARVDLAEGLHSVQRDASRSSRLLDDVSDQTLLSLFERFFSGELSEVLRASAEEQAWARHVVAPAVPTIIGPSMYLVTAPAAADRLLISEGDKAGVWRIEAGRFDALLRGIRAQLG